MTGDTLVLSPQAIDIRNADVTRQCNAGIKLKMETLAGTTICFEYVHHLKHAFKYCIITDMQFSHFL